MSTKAIREALSDYLSACATANDLAGRAREPDDSERATYRAALVEVEAIERAAVVVVDDAGVFACQREDESSVEAAVETLKNIADSVREPQP